MVVELTDISKYSRPVIYLHVHTTGGIITEHRVICMWRDTSTDK